MAIEVDKTPKNLVFKGTVSSTLRARDQDFKAALTREVRELAWPWVESGDYRPVIHKTFPAPEAAAAHHLMESSQHIGKILLQWQDA